MTYSTEVGRSAIAPSLSRWTHASETDLTMEFDRTTSTRVSHALSLCLVASLSLPSRSLLTGSSHWSLKSAGKLVFIHFNKDEADQMPSWTNRNPQRRKTFEYSVHQRRTSSQCAGKRIAIDTYSFRDWKRKEKGERKGWEKRMQHFDWCVAFTVFSLLLRKSSHAEHSVQDLHDHRLYHSPRLEQPCRMLCRCLTNHYLWMNLRSMLSCLLRLECMSIIIWKITVRFGKFLPFPLTNFFVCTDSSMIGSSSWLEVLSIFKRFCNCFFNDVRFDLLFPFELFKSVTTGVSRWSVGSFFNVVESMSSTFVRSLIVSSLETECTSSLVTVASEAIPLSPIVLLSERVGGSSSWCKDENEEEECSTGWTSSVILPRELLRPVTNAPSVTNDESSADLLFWFFVERRSRLVFTLKENWMNMKDAFSFKWRDERREVLNLNCSGFALIVSYFHSREWPI